MTPIYLKFSNFNIWLIFTLLLKFYGINPTLYFQIKNLPNIIFKPVQYLKMNFNLPKMP